MRAWPATKSSLGFVLLCTSASAQSASTKPAEDGLAGQVERARLTRDETQLDSLKAKFERRIGQNDCDANCYYELARVQIFLADAYELKKDKKRAQAETERGMEIAQHSLELDGKSADAHAVLADLYAHRITYGAAMFTGPKYGPKISDEITKGMSLDDKNPRVWATQGRKFLMAPKMFGGDVAKSIESFKKSLELDGTQAETWSWLAKAYKKHGDGAKANEAIQKALQLEPENPMVKTAAEEISH